MLVLLLVLPLVLPLVLTLSVQGMGGGDMFAGMEAMLGVSSSFSSMSFSSSSTTMRGGGGVSERTETTIENGKRVTKRIKTNADGSTEAVTLLWGGDQRKKWLVVSEDGFDELDGWMRGRTSSTV